jgi:hemolysin III
MYNEVAQIGNVPDATHDGHPAGLDPGFLSTELTNTATHGVGLGLSIAGLAVLVAMAVEHGTARHVVACSVYGVTLVGLYLASTLYHTVQAPRAKRMLRTVDHAAIFLLIAGTYTPFTLAAIGGVWGWSLFGIVWGLALVGVLMKMLWKPSMHGWSTVLYLGMGWLAVFALKPLMEVQSPAGIAWLFAGGLSYTLGVVFFAWKRLPHHHAIWHVFVMIGSACHFFTVMYFVVPRGPSGS